MSEVSNIYKDWSAKVRAYQKTSYGAKSRGSLIPGSPGRKHSTILEGSSVVIAEHRLKPLELPKFDGDPRKFMEFKELFENLIHNNHDLANVYKMHCLKEALVGGAAETARAFHLQDKAYPEA